MMNTYHRCRGPAQFIYSSARAFCSFDKSASQAGTSGSVNGNVEAPISVDPQLQDLFARLSKDQKSNAKVQQVSPMNDRSMRAVGRPRQPSLNMVSDGKRLEALPNLLATAAWAFGHVKHHHKVWGQMSRLLIQNTELMRRMEPDDVIKLAGGFAKAKVYDRRLFKQVAKLSVNCMPRFSAHQLSQLAWSFSEVRHLGEDSMLDALAEMATAHLSEFELRDLVQLLRALADLNALTMELLLKCTPRLTASIEQLKTSALLDTLASIASVMSRQNAGIYSLPQNLEPLVVLLQKAAPVLVTRADKVCLELQQEIHSGSGELASSGEAAVLVARLKPEWPLWARAGQAFLMPGLASPEARDLVSGSLQQVQKFKSSSLPGSNFSLEPSPS